MYHGTDYARSHSGSAQIWALTREFEMLSTDGIHVGATLATDAAGPFLTDRLLEMPLLRRVRVAAADPVEWAALLASGSRRRCLRAPRPRRPAPTSPWSSTACRSIAATTSC